MQRKIYLFLVIAVMVSIFVFSAMRGNQSSAMSGRITNWIIGIIYPDYSAMPAEQRIGAFRLMEHIVRKGAHFTEYAVLGALVALLINTFSFRNQYLIALLLSVCYAISDEWHQSFVAGRSPMLQDVMIDTAGAALGIVIIIMLLLIRRKQFVRSSDS